MYTCPKFPFQTIPPSPTRMCVCVYWERDGGERHVSVYKYKYSPFASMYVKYAQTRVRVCICVHVTMTDNSGSTQTRAEHAHPTPGTAGVRTHGLQQVNRAN